MILAFVLSLFPLLWYFNQRLNYRKFLTLNTKFSISANSEPISDLSSSMDILKFLEISGIDAKYDTDFIEGTPFDILGRALITKYGNIEIYEYSNKKDASKQLKSLFSFNVAYKSNVYQYKNLLIYDKTNTLEIKKLLEGITNAQMVQ